MGLMTKILKFLRGCLNSKTHMTSCFIYLKRLPQSQQSFQDKQIRKLA